MGNVDQAAPKAFGIKVFNTPGVLTDAVAELTLGLMLSVLCKIALLDRKMHAG
jgi:lactate dehydrogenase-like 2-hydroxyacid dehydrogenase